MDGVEEQGKEQRIVVTAHVLCVYTYLLHTMTGGLIYNSRARPVCVTVVFPDKIGQGRLSGT